MTAPTASVTSDYSVFSPVGEGTRNLLTFTQSGSKDAAWTGTVTDAASRAVRTVTWKGAADAKFVFDGHDAHRRPPARREVRVPAGGHRRAGNAGSSALLPFEIDTTATPVIVTTDLSAFSPNGDGVRDVIRIVPSLKVTVRST